MHFLAGDPFLEFLQPLASLSYLLLPALTFFLLLVRILVIKLKTH